MYGRVRSQTECRNSLVLGDCLVKNAWLFRVAIEDHFTETIYNLLSFTAGVGQISGRLWQTARLLHGQSKYDQEVQNLSQTLSHIVRAVEPDLLLLIQAVFELTFFVDP